MTADQHDRFDELVAGHALSALEPEDEQLLLGHLPSCAACERALDVHRETLASLAYAVEPPPPLPGAVWDGIREQVHGASPTSFSPPTADEHLPVPVDLAQERLRRRGVRRTAIVASAAALALVPGLGAWNLSLQRDRDGSSPPPTRLAAAVRAVETAPATTVPLRTAAGPSRRSRSCRATG